MSIKIFNNTSCANSHIITNYYFFQYWDCFAVDVLAADLIMRTVYVCDIIDEIMMFPNKRFCADILKFLTVFIVLIQMVRKIFTTEILINFNSIIQYEKARHDTYHRLVQRRSKKRAIIAIARMILTAIYQMLSTGEAWNPSDLYKVDIPKALLEK